MGRSRWGSCRGRARGMVCMDSTQRPERCGRLTPISAVVMGNRTCGQEARLRRCSWMCARPRWVRVIQVQWWAAARVESSSMVTRQTGWDPSPATVVTWQRLPLLVEDLLDRGQVPQGAPALPGGHGGVGGQAPARGVARANTQGRQHVVV